MTSKLIIAFLSVSLLINNLYAENITPKRAKDILGKALKSQKTRSFTGSSH